jgi:anti-sigma B factor antagonist
MIYQYIITRIRRHKMNNIIVPGFDDENDESLNLRLQRIMGIEGGLIIRATGNIDIYNVGSFRKRTEKAVEAGFVRLIMDMGGVPFASSAGIGAIVHLLRSVKPRNGEVVLLKIQPKVFGVLELLGFAQFFPLKETLDESLAYLGEHYEPHMFPKLFTCPICNKRLRARRSGQSRCVECRTLLMVDQAAVVSLC